MKFLTLANASWRMASLGESGVSSKSSSILAWNAEYTREQNQQSNSRNEGTKDNGSTGDAKNRISFLTVRTDPVTSQNEKSEMKERSDLGRKAITQGVE